MHDIVNIIDRESERLSMLTDRYCQDNDIDDATFNVALAAAVEVTELADLLASGRADQIIWAASED